MAIIRGRHRGLHGVTFADFLDLVWVEIWDDCSPMGDVSQYREIVTKLFIEGMEPWRITYTTTDKKGKKVTKRLGDRPEGGRSFAPSKSMMEQARALHQQLQALKAAAQEGDKVASPPDG